MVQTYPLQEVREGFQIGSKPDRQDFEDGTDYAGDCLKYLLPGGMYLYMRGYVIFIAYPQYHLHDADSLL